MMRPGAGVKMPAMMTAHGIAKRAVAGGAFHPRQLHQPQHQGGKGGIGVDLNGQRCARERRKIHNGVTPMLIVLT
jgi:hypothetical protein